MAIRDLIPWNRGRELSIRRSEELNPFLTLHREANRLFDEMFRGFDLAPFGTADRLFDRGLGWPNVDVNETNKEVEVTAELPGVDEKDVDVQIANGVLTIRGEKKTETEDKDRRFSGAFMGISSGEFPSMILTRARLRPLTRTFCWRWRAWPWQDKRQNCASDGSLGGEFPSGRRPCSSHSSKPWVNYNPRAEERRR
jgi:HSP20 family protein